MIYKFYVSFRFSHWYLFRNKLYLLNNILLFHLQILLLYEMNKNFYLISYLFYAHNLWLELIYIFLNYILLAYGDDCNHKNNYFFEFHILHMDCMAITLFHSQYQLYKFVLLFYHQHIMLYNNNSWKRNLNIMFVII